MGMADTTGTLLDEQIAYYRAIAPEYGEDKIPAPGADELSSALEAFRPTGHILELACGPGEWTGQLLRHATSLTAVDSSPEMLGRAKAQVGRGGRVRFIRANLFNWEVDRRYDLVFFGFWLSHVPMDRFEEFWSFVATCLEPTGRVFFVDDNYRTADELIEGPSSSTIRRRLKDGSAYRAVKVAHQPAELERQLVRLGWQIQVRSTAGPFYWGAGTAR